MSTKAEAEHLNALSEIGCIICGDEAEAHHVRYKAGMGQRARHYHAIPLCPTHHRLSGPGVALHEGLRTFEENHGTEQELLERVKRELEKRGTGHPERIVP